MRLETRREAGEGVERVRSGRVYVCMYVCVYVEGFVRSKLLLALAKMSGLDGVAGGS